jgi:DNA-binding transcriptional ArsR family regulator
MARSSPTADSTLEVVHALVPVLKAISDDYRLAILLLLSKESRTVVELTEELQLAQPLVSHHLKALREAGLISLTPEGRSNRYAICCEAVGAPIRFLSGLASATPRE